MKYKNLHELIFSSTSSRNYFLSLPVDMQLKLHEHGDYIHTAAQLHRRAEQIESLIRAKNIADSGIFSKLR